MGAPMGGFDTSKTAAVAPEPSTAQGNGYIVNYAAAKEYFPNPYAVLVSSLLTRNYGTSFVTWPECRRSWEIVDVGTVLDPVPSKVPVYRTGLKWEDRTVQDLYDKQFACTAAHNKIYANVSLYQAKCHPSSSYTDSFFIPM